MREQRLGNDISIVWSILLEGEPFLFGDKNLKLYLRSPHGRKEINDFTIYENKIHWTFYGKDQKDFGKYSLTLVANEGEIGMITVDTCNFVKLVNCSCCLASSNDAPNVELEMIELTSELEYVANITEGGSYDDTAIWDAVTRLEEGKANKEDIPTKLSDLNIDVELGDPYDDTELREAIAYLDNTKVNKELGMGLSSNNFTDAEKNKLSELKNYDDTELKDTLENLKTHKQDTIADLDIIRGGAALGATALQSIPSEYVTENELNNAIATSITNILNTEV